jgi:hypothetical protein
MSYIESTNFLIENKFIKKEDIFNYIETPSEVLFSSYYNFCNETLNIQKFAEITKPNYIYFKNERTINACAKKVKDISLISINAGLIIWADQILRQNQKLNTFFQEAFSEITTRFDVEISELSFQIATQFTFYHELGHLIQFTNIKNEINFQEIYSSDFEITKHYLEVNADSFSSICVATHILQYLERIFKDNLNEDYFNKTIITAGVCLFAYFLKLSDSQNSIYFYEKTHPHPYIRLFNSLMHILNYLSQSEFLKMKGIKVNINELGKFIIDIYSKLEEQNILDTKFGLIFEDTFEKQNEIIQYITKMNNFEEKDYLNALDNWRKTMG